MRAKPNPKVAVAYLRVSTDRQDLGPEAQRASIEAWASREGVTIVAWHEDLGVSGGAGIEDCPGLLAALDALPANGAGLLLVAKRDRLARDAMKAGFIHALVERTGARVVSAAGEGNGSDPTDILLRGIIDLFSQHEKLVIRARTKSALAVKRARGELTGSAPLGYRVVSRGERDPTTRRYTLAPVLEADPEEQRAVAMARDLRASGMSTEKIAAALTDAGIRPRSGGRWYRNQVCRMLARERQ